MHTIRMTVTQVLPQQPFADYSPPHFIHTDMDSIAWVGAPDEIPRPRERHPDLWSRSVTRPFLNPPGERNRGMN